MKDNTTYNAGKYNICGIKDPNLIIKMTKSSTWGIPLIFILIHAIIIWYVISEVDEGTGRNVAIIINVVMIICEIALSRYIYLKQMCKIYFKDNKITIRHELKENVIFDIDPNLEITIDKDKIWVDQSESYTEPTPYYKIYMRQGPIQINLDSRDSKTYMFYNNLELKEK